MTSRSLAFRLLASAALCSAAILLVAGLALSSYYQNLVERGFDQRLNVYLKALVGDLARDADFETIAFSVGEPRFELPLSGWYWQIARRGADTADTVTRASASLFDRNLPFLIDSDPEKDLTATREAYVTGPDDEMLRQVERVIQSGNMRYVVAVGGEASEIGEETAAFNADLTITFLLLGLGLVSTAAMQVAFGLKPLNRISEQLAAIRAGRSERLEGEVPNEIAPLARELNGLLESNREMVERARTQAGNLAHALKTPLSVIVNEAQASSDPAAAAKMVEQAEIMRHQIDHHLDRARVTAGIAAIGACDVRPVIRALVRTMEKVHRDRALRIDLASDDARFRGERQDLEEMVGNLLDNACKWAKSEVAVSVTLARRPKKQPTTVRIVVDDDGPGLTPQEREAALRRGRRLDESKPGSGLGLAIVVDLAALYGGSLTLAAAPQGGLRAELRLPVAE